jgi:hypothetical protein
MRSCNHCCCGKPISFTCSVCVFVALVIQHAMRMRHIVTVAYPALYIFSTLSHKRHDFFLKKSLSKKCVFSFSVQLLLSATFVILSRTERDKIKKCVLVFIKVPRHSCQILKKIDFVNRFSKNTQISNSMTFRLVVPCGQTDRQTDGLTKLIVAFRNFASTSENGRTVELKAGRM